MKTTHYASIIFTLSFLLNTTLCMSQFGIKAGAGMSDIVFSDEGQVPYLGYETDYLTHRYPTLTFQFGVFGTIILNKHFDFQPELLLAKQGLNYNMDFIYEDIENTLDLYYLQVPLSFRYQFALKKKHHPNLFLGPYFAFLIHSKRTKTYDGITETSKAENAKTFDFGLVTGFGYDFNLSSGQITTELRFGYSLINILNPIEDQLPYYGTTNSPKARNLSLTLMVGYRFQNPRKKDN